MFFSFLYHARSIISLGDAPPTTPSGHATSRSAQHSRTHLPKTQQRMKHKRTTATHLSLVPEHSRHHPPINRSEHEPNSYKLNRGKKECSNQTRSRRRRSAPQPRLHPFAFARSQRSVTRRARQNPLGVTCDGENFLCSHIGMSKRWRRTLSLACDPQDLQARETVIVVLI